MKVEILGNKHGHLCVYNCVDTPRGLQIASEMLEWLKPLYQVHVVHHDGSKFEYEGMKYLKELSEKTKEPILYLHTKGAYNKFTLSRRVVNCWRKEFGDRDRAMKYFDAVNHYGPIVACPFSNGHNIPTYNGFVVNYCAMAMADIVESEDRMVYERMWMDNDNVDVRTMKYYGSLHGIHRVLEEEYDS